MEVFVTGDVGPVCGTHPPEICECHRCGYEAHDWAHGYGRKICDRCGGVGFLVGHEGRRVPCLCGGAPGKLTNIDTCLKCGKTREYPADENPPD